MGYLERKKPVRDLALKHFYDLKMINTKDKTGILIFLIFEDRKFEIIADEGINSKISADHWNYISDKFKDHFSKRNFLKVYFIVSEK